MEDVVHLLRLGQEDVLADGDGLLTELLAVGAERDAAEGFGERGLAVERIGIEGADGDVLGAQCGDELLAGQAAEGAGIVTHEK